MNYRKILSVISVAAVFSLLTTIAAVAPVAAAVGQITIGPTNGVTGSTVTVTGANFTAAKTFTIKLGTTTVKTGTTDASGQFSSAFEVPVLPRGQYSVTVTTNAPDTSSSETFSINPEIRAGSASGRVGDQVTVSGTGFRASSTVTFLLDNTSAGTVTTDSNGAFSNASFSVPAIARGQHLLTARDSVGSSPGISFTTSQTLSIAPVSGIVGDKLTLTGRGFAAGSLVTVTLDGQTVNSAAVAADAAGSFANSSFEIPALEAGKHEVRVTDAAGNEAAVEISVTHRLSITPESGTPGTTVRISGDGFRANQPIAITYNDLPVTTSPASIVTNAKGALSGSFDVPGGLTGTYTISVSDGTNTATAGFEATLDTAISQRTSGVAPGHVGMELTVSGTGFKPGSEIMVSLDSSPTIRLATATSDGLGGFSATFLVPAVANGDHTIIATDGTNTREFAFVMESEAPPVPRLLLPDPAAKSPRPVSFDWRDVKDDSGVVYTLQVAKNDKFDTILIEKEGLTESQYTLAPDEDLESVIRQTPYFWRVKATDSAENESIWSDPGSFYLGTVLTLPNGETDLTLSALAVYITGAALIAVFVGVFLLGRRFSRRKIVIASGPVVAVRAPEHKELPEHRESDVYS